MMEVGPWRLDGKGGLNLIEGGWEEYTTMVYGASFDYCFLLSVTERNTTPVDQPAGAGFSYTSSDQFLHDLPEVSRFVGLAPVLHYNI